MDESKFKNRTAMQCVAYGLQRWREYYEGKDPLHTINAEKFLANRIQQVYAALEARDGNTLTKELIYLASDCVFLSELICPEGVYVYETSPGVYGDPNEDV